MAKIDKELELYRNLMPEPDHYEEGFGGKTIVGAIFLGFVMVPASIYLSLFSGGSLGPAAQWVTVILFSEMVKRSLKTLRQQEIFILFYMTGIVMSGSLSQSLLWNQYFVRSPAAISMGIASEIPRWVAPQAGVLEAQGHTFFTAAWMMPILLMAGTMIISRIDNYGLGYAIYRLTVHVEKLPFPMAPVGALGVTALVEDRNNPQRWKQRCFSLGSVLGMAWGLIYVGLPAITGAFFNGKVQIIPIPWLDLTPAMSKETGLFPATPMSLFIDFGLVMAGLALPFWAILGGFLAFISTLIINPMLYHHGMLPTWHENMDVIETGFSNNIDFYLSFGIGLSFAIFLVSIWPLARPIFQILTGTGKVTQAQRRDFSWAGLKRVLTDRNRDRGDLSIITALCIYVASTLIYIRICLWMMPGTPEHGNHDRFPWLFFLGFGFIYQPIISYINAKLAGMVGTSVGIPYIREASYILSGYQGAAIWFAPIPLNDYGGAATGFRQLELTGTRLKSAMKTELVVFPIFLVTSIMFSQLIWRLGDIPGEAFPYTKQVWHLNALNQSLTVTSTLGGTSRFLEAIKPRVILSGGVVGLCSFIFLAFLGLPRMLVYGVVGGMGTTQPGAVLPMMIGALLSRYYFEPRFGKETFKKYAMILLAGFSAGVGLVGMASVAINLIVKSTTTLSY